MCILIGMLEPFTKRSDYNLALINEWFCLVLNYHLFTFTDWVPDGFARNCMGYSMIAVTLFNIAINLSWAGYLSISGLGRTAKLYFLLYKAIKKR